MSKALLVLAASTYQMPVIEAAKRLGYRVITTDNTPSNPGHTLADASFRVDTTDLDGVLALAKQEGISGIIAASTDIAVMTAAHVATHLGIPGPTPEAARILTDKYLFREYLEQIGLPCPQAYQLAGEIPLAEDFCDGRDWLIKPNRSSGSKGIFIIRTQAEFDSRISESRAFSMDGTVVVEEYIKGTQHTCEGVLKEGKAQLALITDRDTALPPYTATMGHRVPSRLPEEMQTRALGIIEQVFGGLGVANGSFDCDFVADGGRIVLIEMTPRLGGNSLSKLFKSALDFDLVGYAVSHACSDTYPLPKHPLLRPSAIAILGVDRPGRLAWDTQEAEALRKETWVDTLSFDLPPGAPVKPFINGRHRVGEALITGADRDEIDAHLIEFQRRLALEAV